ncbi:hypothetical protein [Prescottella equi]|uniref:hypothetical protein n=1 Tax=Rhodococcus hoagii TaxID=43767 RepID=UPI000D0FA40E|nr:hypothetical protein [Prescottella equi]AVP71335.1 hypothetical protein C7H75_24955 [Prescottella equi]
MPEIEIPAKYIRIIVEAAADLHEAATVRDRTRHADILAAVAESGCAFTGVPLPSLLSGPAHELVAERPRPSFLTSTVIQRREWETGLEADYRSRLEAALAAV